MTSTMGVLNSAPATNMGVFNLPSNVKEWGFPELIAHFDFGTSLLDKDLIEIK